MHSMWHTQHTLADRKCTPSLEQNNTNLMSCSFPTYQAQEMAHLRNSRIVSNIRPSLASNSSFEILTRNTEDNQARVQKDKKKEEYTITYPPLQYPKRTFSGSRDKESPESYLSMREQSFTVYEDERTVTHI